MEKLKIQFNDELIKTGDTEPIYYTGEEEHDIINELEVKADSIRNRIIQSGGTILVTRTGKDDFTAKLVDQPDQELDELFAKLVN